MRSLITSSSSFSFSFFSAMFVHLSGSTLILFDRKMETKYLKRFYIYSVVSFTSLTTTWFFLLHSYHDWAFHSVFFFSSSSKEDKNKFIHIAFKRKIRIKYLSLIWWKKHLNRSKASDLLSISESFTPYVSLGNHLT